MTDPRMLSLARYLATVDHTLTPTVFWADWDAIAGDLATLVWSEEAEPEAREAFTDLLARADDAGWAVPTDQVELAGSRSLRRQQSSFGEPKARAA